MNKKTIIVSIILVLVFPILIGLIYSFNTKQYINVSSSDLLGYYSTVFGIFVSLYTFYFTYRLDEEKREHEKKEKEEQEKKEKEEKECRDRENSKPHLVIELVKEKSNNIFTLKIDGCEKNKFSNIYIYDVLLNYLWTKPHCEYKICFEQPKSEHIKYIDDCYEGLNDEGYPIAIYIVCEDIKTGNIWLTIFEKNKK